MIKLTINQKLYSVDAPPDMPLLWVLRDLLGLTGTKFGCGMAQCGACTVHLNGEAVRSCVTLVGRAAGQQVVTIEGLSDDRSHPLQKAWIEEDVPQCGYCQSGQIMSAAELLRDVKRGPDGKGLYALKCSNCHQPANTPGLNMPPGNPNWHLPPENMKMVFEGRSAKELATQLLDMTRNGGKTKEQLVEHVTSDKLVLGGWNPGEGRTLPPLTHKKFAQQFKLWIESGAYAPD